MCGWFRLAIVFASRSNRSRNSARSGEMSGKNLDGDDSIEARIAGFVHLAHPARTDGGEDFVRTEFCAGGEHHLFNLAAQFRTTVIGLTSTSITSVLIRNRWPSLLTS